MTFEAGQTVELICVQGFDAIRSRLSPDGPIVVVRTGLSTERPVPGELFRVDVERAWVFGRTQYLKGFVTKTRLDVGMLALTSLRLERSHSFDPEKEDWLFGDADHGIYAEIRDAGVRPSYEMEQVLPQDGIELLYEEDAILDAAVLQSVGALREAEALLGELLAADVRCLDAHAHLGNLCFRESRARSLDRAARHYATGVAIGSLSLGDDFRGLLPWGLIDNRPFLRCLHGHGLCHWRSGELEAAKEGFRRLLWLSPHDNQGARFNLAALEDGRSWDELA